MTNPATPPPPSAFALTDERGVLRLSVAATMFVAAVGIAFGLLSGSGAILFDGIYSLLDASMSLLALVVVGLIRSYALSQELPRRLRERFTFGFWHLEPMVLGLNGTMLIGAAVYGLVTAIGSILSGGHVLQFGWAMVYAAVTIVVCGGIALVEARANRRLRSAFVALDVRSWIMSAAITGALLVAFAIGLAVRGTRWAWVAPYVDPAVLAIVCLVVIPVPVRTVRRALSQVLLITPPELRLRIDRVASAYVETHGFLGYRAYSAQVGRAEQIELYFIVPPDAPARGVGEWDAIRDEVADALGEDSPDRWLTIVFTADPEWA